MRKTHRGRRPPTRPEGEKPGLAARRTAARLLGAVVDAHTPLDALTDGEHGHPHFLALAPRDRALVRAILASALRHRRTIETLLQGYLERPLPAGAHALSHILHVGAAQILFLDVPDSAAVDLAVSHAAADPRAARFSRLVNAVLRRLARDRQKTLPRALAQTCDAPDWLAERLTAVYGAVQARAIMEAHRREPPVDFTVKTDPSLWAERLGGRVLANGSVRVERLPAPVPDLPGYAEGQWWVQDAAASLPARLLGDVTGRAVADLCAAPGGKTAQLALAGAQVTALDQSASRLARLNANLQRLGLAATLVESDLRRWRPERPFDAVLLDAPCSSTGTIRRHPDVAWTKTPEDIATMAQVQEQLLESALLLVRPGGPLVFSNCSLDPAEGEALVEALLARRQDVTLDPIQPGELPGAEDFIAPQGWLRTTPAGGGALADVDGFFAVRLRRLR
ncbi:methyltransferase domain-containing protein [Chelativorans intermedius]|nr:RsmB/NOP family class I SAM-dependent RNA methyltransferase [Chelativorans intermedius]MCT8999320.1 methyltransferase domain-containing protein [Chelativorans intermedius]